MTSGTLLIIPRPGQGSQHVVDADSGKGALRRRRRESHRPQRITLAQLKRLHVSLTAHTKVRPAPPAQAPVHPACSPSLGQAGPHRPGLWAGPCGHSVCSPGAQTASLTLPCTRTPLRLRARPAPVRGHPCGQAPGLDPGTSRG